MMMRTSALTRAGILLLVLTLINQGSSQTTNMTSTMPGTTGTTGNVTMTDMPGTTGTTGNVTMTDIPGTTGTAGMVTVATDRAGQTATSLGSAATSAGPMDTSTGPTDTSTGPTGTSLGSTGTSLGETPTSGSEAPTSLEPTATSSEATATSQEPTDTSVGGTTTSTNETITPLGQTTSSTDQNTTSLSRTLSSTPPPCEDPTICTDRNFVNCINEGAGEYRCENCTEGYNKEGDECVVYKTLTGEMKIDAINGGEAEYSVDLTDSSSDRYMTLSTGVCDVVGSALTEDSKTTFYDCDVSEFRNGSIIAIFALTLDNSTTATASEIVTTLVAAFNDSVVFGVDGSSFVLTDVCDGTTCSNGGFCIADSDLDPMCICSNGYTGESCDDTTSTAQSGLSLGAIIGIAIGCSILIILIIVIIIIVVCKLCCRGKVDPEDPQQEEECIVPPAGKEQEQDDYC